MSPCCGIGSMAKHQENLDLLPCKVACTDRKSPLHAGNFKLVVIEGSSASLAAKWEQSLRS